MADTLYIIDGHSQIFRSYYAPFRDLTSPTGEPTRATYVFTTMLLKFISENKPSYLAMAVDGPRKDLIRTQRFPDYKAQRKPTPEDLIPQAERIIEIVKALGIPVLEAKGYEADDVMATAVEQLAGNDLRVVLVSRDKDLDQLLGQNVVMYDPMKDETFDESFIEKQKGYSPEKAVEIQTLTGDTSDNVPGVPGVGPKTAVKLINEYGTAEAVVAAADELSPKLRKNLLAFRDRLALTRELVTLRRDVPIELDLESMKADRLEYDAVGPVFAELGFNKLIDTLQELAGHELDIELPPAGAGTAGATTADDFAYRLVDTPARLDALAAALVGVDRLAVDTETTGTNTMRCSLVGISLAFNPGEGFYLPLRSPLMEPELDSALVLEKIGPFLADASIEKVGHNLKFDLIVMENHGFELRGRLFDTMIAAYVLDPTRMTYKLDALVMEYLNHRCIPIEDLIGRGKKQVTMDAVPTEIVSVYAAEDAETTLRLAPLLEKQLADENLHTLFRELEMQLMPVLAKMEQVGIRVLPERLKEMETELSRAADELAERIVEAAGVTFNPDSPKQLANVLFEHRGLPVIKKKKTGPSTDSSVLEQLAAETDSPLPGLVLDYRELKKLIGTYLQGLAKCINPATGRIHTSFHQVATETGRLSSSDPNLQNIPVRTERGRRIRSAFLADDGHALLSADYSQIEIRILAHFCGDETLHEAFDDDRDIHTAVAAEIFETEIDDVTPDQRGLAKTVNFGIIYGQTAFGLSNTLRISRKEAADFIARYTERFSKIDRLRRQTIDQTRSRGYVETIMGRRRKIPAISADNTQKKKAAERLAFNTLIQGSAADLIKQAMINIARRIAEESRPSRMLVQIHDELIFEIPQANVDSERDMIVTEMAGAVQLDVPLKVDTGAGDDWLAAK